jgi:rod shape-determining protein MreC
VSLEVAPKLKEGRAAVVLIPLLVMHLVLISLQIEDRGGTTLFRKWVLTSGAPFLSASSAVSGGLAGFWGGYIWLVGARAENHNLRETLSTLTLQNQALSDLKLENLRLKELLEFKESQGIQTLGARVVGRVPDYLAHMVYIDRGAADGVKVDMAVIAGYGAAGRAVLVSPHQAQVQLITNADASVGAMLATSRSPGVLRGTGGNLLRLEYINNTEEVAVGETVVCSGLDGVFPKGIPLGKVVNSRKGRTVFRDIEVEPFADLLRIEEVLLVVRAGNQVEPALPPAP